MIYSILEFEEGFRSKMYVCSEGYATIGYGTKVSMRQLPREDHMIHDYYGALEIDRDTAKMMMLKHLTRMYDSMPPVYQTLSEERKVILLSMAYQLGMTGLLKFKKMWVALEEGDFKEAAVQMMDSLWARQTSNRAIRHKIQMETGVLHPQYQ